MTLCALNIPVFCYFGDKDYLRANSIEWARAWKKGKETRADATENNKAHEQNKSRTHLDLVQVIGSHMN